MKLKFSQEMLSILGYARDEAMRTGSYGIGADHIVLGLLRHRDNNACRAIEACGIDPGTLKEEIDARVFRDRAVPWQDRALVRPTRAAGALLSAAAYETLKYGQHVILSSHFLLALLRSADSAAGEFLQRAGIGYERLCALMRAQRFVVNRQEQQAPLPKLEDLLGPLGEQLTQLFGDVQAKTNFIS